MTKRIGLAIAGLALACLPLGGVAQAFTPAAPNGPHGCFLSDANGTSPVPVVHDSDTSHIGGNSCTYTQVPTNEPSGDGGSYFAAAQTWSVTACTPTVDAAGKSQCTPDGSWSSAAGSAPVGPHVIKVGDQVTVSVTNGAIIAGTPNGAPGA